MTILPLDGTAIAAGDYGAAFGMLTFAPGQVSQTVTVLVVGDTAVEPDETFFLLLASPVNATIAAGTGTGTITNDDQQASVSLSIQNVSLPEGNGGTTPFLFTVNLSAPAPNPVTVQYATANGTAVSGGKNLDYTRAAGTLSFAPGETSKTLSVLVNGDTLIEPDETFSVTLSGAVGADIVVGTGTGTIVNDDILPLLSIGSVARAEGNSGTVAFSFTVSLSAPSSAAVSVRYASSDGTASAHGKNADYASARGTLTFAPGETTQTVTVLVNGDRLVEADETFFVSLSHPTGATIAQDQGVGTILNDDGLALAALAQTVLLPAGLDGRPSSRANAQPERTLPSPAGVARANDGGRGDGTPVASNPDGARTREQFFAVLGQVARTPGETAGWWDKDFTIPAF